MSINNVLNNTIENLGTMLNSSEVKLNTSSAKYDICCILNNTIQHIYDIIYKPDFHLQSAIYPVLVDYKKGEIKAHLKLYSNGQFKCFMIYKDISKNSDNIEYLNEYIIPITSDIFGHLHKAGGKLNDIDNTTMQHIITAIQTYKTEYISGDDVMPIDKS